jgi:1A family penicillin-binding protein
MARYITAIGNLRLGIGDTTFYDANGRPWFRMDEQRRDVPLAGISPLLRHAVIAVEDHRFYRHGGIDLIGVLRAVLANLRSGQVVEGASTITQQLARTVFLSNRRTLGRKSREAVLAWLIEQRLSKDRILELYLNRVYMGGGVYGVENISRRLFGKSARDLTLPQAAMIAGLIRSPSTLTPWVNPKGAIARSHVVLARMRAAGFITPELERAAAANPPAIQPFAVASGAREGYAKEFLRQQFRERFGDEHPPDWQVHTTFLPELQDMAEEAVARGLEHLPAGVQAALVAIDPQTGNLLALVGGRDFRASQFNRALRSKRQPGSAFKPFVYTAALENGYSPASVIGGLGQFTAAGPDEWSPENAHGDMPDAMTLREAFLESNNRAAAALQQKVSSQPVLRLASDAGIHGLPDVPSLALGTGEVTPLDLTAAYAVFANGGWAVQPRAIERVLGRGGSVELETSVQHTRVLQPEVAFQMVSMLEDVIGRGTGSAARSLGVDFPAGGKTGTTDGFKDAWFVGFSSNLVVGVWVGFDEPATIGPAAYGARVALPIWADFMTHAASVIRPGTFEVPAGLTPVLLCSVSYLQPMRDCPTYTEYFKEGDAVPSGLCPLHSGPVEQRASRAARGFFSAIGRGLKSLFGRK